MRAKGTEEPIAEIHHRAYAGDPDFWRIRTFLIDTYSITQLGLNWDVRRWDGFMFYNREPGIPDDVATNIHLWHQAGGELVGVLYPDGSRQVHLFIHPGFRDLE